MARNKKPNRNEFRRLKNKYHKRKPDTNLDQDKPLPSIDGQVFDGKLLDEVATHAANRQGWKSGEARRVIDGYVGADAEDVSLIPCELCGDTDAFREDRYALMKPAREHPLTEMDADAAKDGLRQVRICATCINEDEKVRTTLNKIDADDAEDIDPEVMNHVHERLVGGDADPSTIEPMLPWVNRRVDSLNDQNEALETEKRRLEQERDQIYKAIRRDLDKLVKRKVLTKEDVRKENLPVTIAVLTVVREQYGGDVMARSDLRDLFQSVRAESEFCRDCSKVWPKGTHQHYADSEGSTVSSTSTNHMNGSRQANAAQLTTLINLANFCAFEKVIPHSVIRQIDSSGTHLLHYRSHGSMARGVPCRDYFRCEVYVKLVGRSKAHIVTLDAVPSWFTRLEEVPEARQWQKGTDDVRLHRTEIAEEALEPGSYTRRPEWSLPDALVASETVEEKLAELAGQVAQKWNDSHPDEPIPDHLTLESLTRDRRASQVFQSEESDDQNRDALALQRVAEKRGLESYRDLGDFEAFSWIANHPSPFIVNDRWQILLSTVTRTGPRRFTLEDVKETVRVNSIYPVTKVDPTQAQF